MRYTDDDRQRLSRRTAADERALEALRPILALPQPSKLRALRVVCPNDHRLVDVYLTVIGPVYLGEAAASYGAGAPDQDGAYDAVRYDQRAIHASGALDIVQAWRELDLDLADLTSEFVCRCRNVEIRLDWLSYQLARGRRRVVWTQTIT